MKLPILSFFLATSCGLAANPTQPAIAPDGVVNAASYLARGFSNSGIARGSLFLIFGSYLGPDTLASAAAYPLPDSDGLAGTRVRIDAGGFTAFALMVYTSNRQVAAILPSNAPEGDATLTLNYNNLTSNPVVIRIVRSRFGMFTLNQAGSGPAIAQNFVTQTDQPVNTLLTAATPGQTMILWGTGLGPATGNEAAGPVPGALPYLDTLYVGGRAATVRYAGRSGCCAGVDQIVFDVPAGIAGCYVPVAAVSGGVVSNLGTIAIANGGRTCDDALAFRALDLSTLQRGGRLRVGLITLYHQTTAGISAGADSLTGTFSSYSAQTAMSTAVPLNPSLGSCYAVEAPVDFDFGSLPHGDALNAGFQITASGPMSLIAPSISPGNYFVNVIPADLPAGNYAVSGAGGADIGVFQGNLAVPAAVQWSNSADFSSSVIRTGQPLVFKWTGGDPAGYVKVQILASNTALQMELQCNAAVSAGSLTVPDYLTRALPQGQGILVVSAYTMPSAFTAPGLDVALVRAGSATTMQVNLQTPPGN